MFSSRHLAVAAASLLSLFATANAQAGLTQMQYIGCFSTASPMYTNSSLTYQYQASGWCQEQCGKWAEKAAFALNRGSDCWCGDKYPPQSTQVDDDQCNKPCQGYNEMCGGMTTFSVYNSGLVTNVEYSSDDEAESAQTTTAATKSSKATPTASLVQSTVTQAGQTIVVTASATSAATSEPAKSGSGGTSKAGIAAGVVVGLVAIAAIAGGVFFYMRHRRRREIEADHQRQQTISNFTRGGTIKSEHSSADSRLDPTMMYRRQSDGSIADERDLSRRVLKVTNPDRNTMIA